MSSTCNCRFNAGLLVPLLAIILPGFGCTTSLAFPSVPTSGSGEYIASLNLAVLGSAFLISEIDPGEVADLCEALPENISREGFNTRLIDAQRGVAYDRRDLEPWRSPEWRQNLVRFADCLWARLIVAAFSEYQLADGTTITSRRIESGNTSVLLRIDPEEATEIQLVFQKVALDALFLSDLSPGILDPAPLFVVEPNEDLSPTVEPNDPQFRNQWALERINAPVAWDHVTGSGSIELAIIDSGLDHRHSDLGPIEDGCDRTVTGRDSSDLKDPTGHGTAMAGIISSGTNNGKFVAGISWCTNLLILKELSADNRGKVWNVARAIDEAAGLGARIISLSLGGRVTSDEDRDELLNAIIRAAATDTLVVAAAGNDNFDLDKPDGYFFPASFKETYECPPSGWCFDNFLVVGATDLDPMHPALDRRAAFSNFGEGAVDLGAPGVSIITSGLVGRRSLSEVTGTSASTALVAGAASLVASSLGTCGPPASYCYVETKRRLLDGADRVAELCHCFTKARRLNLFGAVSNRTETPDPCTVEPSPRC